MGVSGSGKTTVGKKLAEKINLPFYDGDDFHSEENKKKMAAGEPLTDDDRVGWLIKLNDLAKRKMKKKGAIIACSALKEKYRRVLSGGIRGPVVWIFLQGCYELIKKRMDERKDHFMPPGLLASQFDTLEIPENCITIDISKSPDEIVEIIISELEKRNPVKSSI
jgi:carbohydrate kinase (thermoresistant glucokinase family)